MRISPKDLTRRIMMRYLDYCQAPPVALIAYRNVAQFVFDKEWESDCPTPNGDLSLASVSWAASCHTASANRP